MEHFSIIKTYLKQANFSSPMTPEVFFKEQEANCHLSVQYNTSTQKADNAPLYIVNLDCNLDAIGGEGNVVFSINIVWSAVVNIEEEMEEDERKEILCVLVPQNIFDSQRVLIYNIIRESGFPPILLKDFDFSVNQENAQTGSTGQPREDACIEDTETEILDWEYAVSHMIASCREAKEFFDLYEEKIDGGPFDFEESLLNQYLYRFVPKVQYKHPDTIESRCFIYDILPSILWCDPEAVCELVVAEDGELPEFQFSYRGNTGKISELTRTEMLSLLDGLLTTAFSQTACNLWLMNKDEDLCNELSDGSFKNITREEYYKLCGYGTNNRELDTEIEKLFERIQHADEQSFIYRI